MSTKDIPPTTTGDTAAASGKPHGVLKRLYHGQTKADIVGRWKTWFAISGVLLLIGIAAVATNGMNLGIDFTGGTVWQVEAGKAQVVDVSRAMTALGYKDAQVQEITQASGGDNTRFIRVEAEAAAEPATETTAALDRARDGLASTKDKAPASARDDVKAVIDNLNGVRGPFRTAVPEPLAELQTELTAFPKAFEAAKGDKARAAFTTASAAKMERSVEALVSLEEAERSRLSEDVTQELAKLTGTPAAQITIDTVGPSWGRQISEKARNALVVFMIAITIFITIRFELKMALATVAALFHDLLLVVGFYAVFKFPVTPATVIALLTMLGFSIYDGIVVFDRVNENTKLVTSKGKMTYTEMANLSLNQVLMRSLNTSISSLLPILSVLLIGAFVMGDSTLEEFGLALFLGLMSGAYSSIFIATPLLAILKEREPQYREIRDRIAGRASQVGSDLVDAVAGAPGSQASGPAVSVANAAAPGGVPRPRKPGKR